MIIRNFSGAVAAVLLAASVATPVSGAEPSRTFYRCIDPVESVCTATDEEGKAGCGQACSKWTEYEIDTRWFTQTAMADGPASNFVLENAAEALYGVHARAKGSGPKIAEVFADPQKYGYAEIAPGSADLGTLVVLPGIAGIVVRQAATPGDVTIIYASAKAGAAKENVLKFLMGDAQPKFVVPSRFAKK